MSVYVINMLRVGMRLNGVVKKQQDASKEREKCIYM